MNLIILSRTNNYPGTVNNEDEEVRFNFDPIPTNNADNVYIL